jgi:Tol biopolymer transport system component
LILSVALAAAAYGQGFGKNKVRYENFDWHIYQSPHFQVYYYPKEEASLEKVVSFAESAYDRLSQELDYQIQEPTPLILFATHSEFLQNNVILNFIPEGVAAFATSARFRMVMPIDLPDAELYELMLHELTHIFQYHILFGASLGRSLTLGAPTWLIEGMASYFAEDESTSDKMYLRDAVVNDTIPPITESNVQGFFAYRFGHAAFDFMEERWGRDGVLDFLFELRNTLGGRVGRAVERAFRIEPEDFDIEFRRWLRRKYLPQLVETGEPSDFGRPFRTERGQSQESSGVASPSGDLVAAFSTYQNDLDIALFDTESRQPIRNLTKGFDTEFRNYVAQLLTVARRHGRDIAFSPDGNQLAVFVRKEAGYSLALVNVLKGGVSRVIDMEIQQQTAPAWSPDGRSVAFSGNLAGQFDIFLLDLETLEISNLTNDDIFDGGPTFSPDGSKLVFVSVPESGAQLFQVVLDDPTRRTRLTDDEFTNTDPVFSSDGETIYFTSDRTGAENIFGLDLASRELAQYTNAVTGCFMPTVLSKVGEPDRLVYTGYWKGRFDLYESEIAEPLTVTQLEAESAPALEEIPRFVPDIQVSIDESKKKDKKGFKLFIEDADYIVGVDDDQTFVGQVVMTFSDFLGDRRLIALFQSVESFSNFNVTYADLSRRWQWSATVFDDRDFFIGQDFRDGDFFRGRRLFRQTGVVGTLTYPFSFQRRFEVSAGFIDREIELGSFAFDSRGNPIFDDAGLPILAFPPSDEQYPLIGAALVSDTSIYGPAGPTAGHRVRFGGSWGADLDESGTLTSTIELDARKYLPITRRSVLALRLFGSVRDGRLPSPLYFGGFDTVRGFDFRDFVGDRGFYGNVEVRFPLIDLLATPILAFQGIQGRLFFDVAGAWFDDVQDFDFYDSDTERLDDGVATYGMGFTIRFFGLDLHFDYAKRWDLEESGETFTTFWIGQRF